MSVNTKIGPESQESSKKDFESFVYIEIGDNYLDKSDEIINILREKKIFGDDIAKEYDFIDFLEDFFLKNNIDETQILGIEGKNNALYIYISGEKVYKISQTDIQNFLINQAIGNETKEQVETKVQNIHEAIETIYVDNYGILFNGEINDEDILKTDAFGPDLKGKTLKQLKELLDVENKKLFQVYKNTGESKKQQDLLKKELQFFVGVGDKYEGGAEYFSLSSEEIEEKAVNLVNTMSFPELFGYIRDLNVTIDNNYKRSDMVNQVNLKLMKTLYIYSFERIKKEQASEEICIEFIKIITGRTKLKDWRINRDLRKIEKIEYKKMQSFEYEQGEIAEMFRDQMLANQVLIYLMYRENGLLSQMENTGDIQIIDKDIGDKTPKQVIDEAKIFFARSFSQGNIELGEKIIKDLGFSSDLEKPYKNLEFMEKIKIGALARLLQELEKLNIEGEGINVEQIQILVQKMIQDTFQDLNENISDNFNETWTDWNGKTAKDLGLTGVQAEVFSLYQDINGNNGAFDWKDENELGMGTIVFGLSMLAGVLILGPTILAIGTAGSLGTAIIIALKGGAIMGLTQTIIAQGLSDKGYDTYKEMVVDVSTQGAIDIGLSSLFTAGGLGVLKASGLTLNPDLIFSREAWRTKAGVIDKSFILSEVLTTMYVSAEVSNMVKQNFANYHMDTDKSKKI